MKIIKRIYNCCIRLLSKSSNIAEVLSHGGFHLFVLLFLLLLVYKLYTSTEKHEETFYSHVAMQAKPIEVGFRGEKTIINPEKVFICNRFNGSFIINKDSSVCLLNYIIDGNKGKVRHYFNKNRRYNLKFQVTSDEVGTQLSCDVDRFFAKIDSLEKGRRYYLFRTNYTELENENNTKSFIRLNPNNRMDSIMLTINESNYHELLFEQPILKNNEYYNVDSLYKESLCFPIYFSFKNNKKNKYTSFNYFIELPRFEFDSQSDSIDSISDVKNDLVITYSEANKPFDVKYVFPQPDVITPSEIRYNSNESLKRLFKNGGVQFIVEDIAAHNKVNRQAFLFTVLIGAIITFMLDIIVVLIRKWRRLHSNK